VNRAVGAASACEITPRRAIVGHLYASVSVANNDLAASITFDDPNRAVDDASNDLNEARIWTYSECGFALRIFKLDVS
jgi:hypothetical protein